MKSFLIYTFCALILVISGCSTSKIPGVYRISIQQGNDVTQEMVNQLHPGMTKRQVAFIMSTPLLIDTFHPNRWDYYFSYHPGNGDRSQRVITLFFDDDELLERVQGDINTVAREDLPTIEKQDVNVVVPLKDQKTGFFYTVKDAVGIGSDDDEIGFEERVETQNKVIEKEISDQADIDAKAVEDGKVISPE